MQVYSKRQIFLVCWLLLVNKGSVANDVDCFSKTLAKQQRKELIQIECPTFYHRLSEKDLMNTLEGTLPERFSRTQLQFLKSAIHPANHQLTLVRSELDTLLGNIYRGELEDENDSLWKQFLNWLERVKPENHEKEFGWLIRVLEAITPSEKTAKIILYTVFGVIILITAGLILRELYLSGIFFRKKSNKKPSNQGFIKQASKTTPRYSLEDIKQFEPRKQQVWLFRRVIFYLVERGILPKDKALTNLELTQKLRKDHPAIDTLFTQLSDEVEPALYGGTNPTCQKLKSSWQHAEKILSQTQG